jgi:hypothetical protein
LAGPTAAAGPFRYEEKKRQTVWLLCLLDAAIFIETEDAAICWFM